MVDQPQAPVPDEQVDIPGRSIDVRDQAVEPDDVGGESGIELGHRPERQGAGQKVESQVETGTALEKLLNFGIRLGRRERWVQLDQDDLGDGQAERPPELTSDQLGDKDPRPLACAVELHHVQPVIIGLDQTGQGTTLAQRGDIAGSGDRPDRHGQVRAGSDCETAGGHRP